MLDIQPLSATFHPHPDPPPSRGREFIYLSNQGGGSYLSATSRGREFIYLSNQVEGSYLPATSRGR